MKLNRVSKNNISSYEIICMYKSGVEYINMIGNIRFTLHFDAFAYYVYFADYPNILL